MTELSPTAARARALAASLEPFAGQVYFSPECHAAYEALGFGPSPTEIAGVAMPDGPAYFCSRASSMGPVPGSVMAATFGVFNPVVVDLAVGFGWGVVDHDADRMFAARTEGAVGQLERVLGTEPDGLDRALDLLHRANAPLRPEGRALFAGVVSRGLPGSPLADAWRLADRLREYRGDGHIAAWIGAGFDATEIGLLTELYWGLPLRTYVRTRAWSNDDLDAAEARLVGRGLVADGAFTDAGRAAREAVEAATDRLAAAPVETLGDDVDELTDILRGWSAQLTAAGAYPAQGPHDLAASRT